MADKDHSEVLADFLQLPPEERNGTIKMEDGKIHSFKNGKLHGQTTLPDGTTLLYEEGKLHSDDAIPTIVHANGEHHFYTHDVLVKVIKADGKVLTGKLIP